MSTEAKIRKIPITVTLDPDVIEWFDRRAGRTPLSVLLREALAEYRERHSKTDAEADADA